MSINSIFLFEYATCGAFPLLDPSITIEGVAMFKTLLNGFKSINSKVSTFIDERIPFFSNYPCVKDFELSFDECIFNSDYSLIIAPESDMELYRFIERLEKSDSMNLGSDSSSVFKASDKYVTYKELIGLDIPKTELFNGKTKMDFPLLAKPREGVSCEGISIIENEKDLENVPEGYLLQEYIAGGSYSASLLVGDDINLLSLNSQEIKDFVYSGAKVPVKVEDLEEIFRAVERIKGLFGYVGVDFVVNERPWIIEINPRPTTPIVAFKKVYNINLAEMILRNYYNEKLEQPIPIKNIFLKKVPADVSGSFVKFQEYSILLEENV